VDVPDRIELRIGEKTTLGLPGLGAAGYSWSHEFKGDNDVVRVSPSAAPAPAGDATRLPPGESVDEWFTIEALARGETILHMLQSRRWEKGKAPRKEYNITITVCD